MWLTLFIYKCRINELFSQLEQKYDIWRKQAAYEVDLQKWFYEVINKINKACV
jgi:hypothetical protein